MREIDGNIIIEKISESLKEINFRLSNEMIKAFDSALENEESEQGKNILLKLKENGEIAIKEKIPLCQDCGLAVFFVEHGEEVRVTGGIKNAITEGVKKGYKEGYLRKSVVEGIERKNTLDNTPPIIHFDIVEGDRIRIHMASKGGGSENMSRLAMMTPAQGIEGVKNFVRETVVKAGSNPCPPIIIGVGIGGNFERSAILAKKALFRNIFDPNKNEELDRLEKEILEIINKTGIGPQGMGGLITALGVNIEMEPCHIASFPVAVNIECHSHRHKEIIF